MKTPLWTAIVSLGLLPGLAPADPWKDESGHGRDGYHKGWGERFGEPPPWARGKGYWDGHFKHAGPPVHRGEIFVPPVRPRFGRQPVVPPLYGPAWGDDRERYKQWREDLRERRKEVREHEREVRQQRREWWRENTRFSAPAAPPSPRWR